MNLGTHEPQGWSGEEWQLNLIKDGGRRVMYGGDAYEDDLEPAADPAEPTPQQPAPDGAGRPSAAVGVRLEFGGR